MKNTKKHINKKYNIILISGATGYLGRTTIDLLLQKTESANIAPLFKNDSKVNVLLKKGFDNESIDVARSRSYSFPDITRIIGKKTNRAIKYFSPALNEFNKHPLQFRVPPVITEMSSAFAHAFSQDEIYLSDETAKQIPDRAVAKLDENLVIHISTNNRR